MTVFTPATQRAKRPDVDTPHKNPNPITIFTKKNIHNIIMCTGSSTYMSYVQNYVQVHQKWCTWSAKMAFMCLFVKMKGGLWIIVSESVQCNP